MTHPPPTHKALSSQLARLPDCSGTAQMNGRTLLAKIFGGLWNNKLQSAVPSALHPCLYNIIKNVHSVADHQTRNNKQENKAGGQLNPRAAPALNPRAAPLQLELQASARK